MATKDIQCEEQVNTENQRAHQPAGEPDDDAGGDHVQRVVIRDLRIEPNGQQRRPPPDKKDRAEMQQCVEASTEPAEEQEMRVGEENERDKEEHERECRRWRAES